MKDKCGRVLAKGQLVDILINDILTAYVVEVKEEVIIQSHGQQPRAQLILNIAIPVTLDIGQEAPCYIVRQAPAEAADAGPKRIM